MNVVYNLRTNVACKHDRYEMMEGLLMSSIKVLAAQDGHTDNGQSVGLLDYKT